MFESKIHTRRQPADLSTDFRNEASDQQPMTYSVFESFGSNKPWIEMNGIVIAGKVCEWGDLGFRKCSGGRKSRPREQSLNCALSDKRHRVILSRQFIELQKQQSHYNTKIHLQI
jgi:hypothetical protein